MGTVRNNVGIKLPGSCGRKQHVRRLWWV